MKMTSEQNPPPVVAHATPGLLWACPIDGCGVASAMPGVQHIATLTNGHSIVLTCRRCGSAVELRRPASKIIRPTMARAYNRVSRRTMAKKNRDV